MNLISNCVLQYKMNDNAASTVVLDSCGAYTGTSQRNTNLLTSEDAPAQQERSFVFEGTDYIDIGSDLQSVFSSAFTVSVWVKLDDGQPPTSGEQTENDIFGMLDGAEGIELWNYTNAGRGELAFYCQGATCGTGISTFADGPTGWTHVVALAYDDGGFAKGRLYVNGGIVGTEKTGFYALADFPALDSVQIGHTNLYLSPFNPARCLRGKIDNFCIFNKVLDDAEIAFLYNDGDGRESLVSVSGCAMGLDSLDQVWENW